MGKTFEVPQGKLGTLFVNGVETELVPGKEYENGELVLTDKLDVHHSCELAEGKPCDYRTAIYIDKNGLNKAGSVVEAVSGGKFDGESAQGVTIKGTSPDFNGVIVNGGKYEIKDSKLSFVTESDGKKVCDFAGLGAAVCAFDGASVKIENSEIETVGVAKCSVFSDEGSDILVKDSKISVMGGKIYDGYVNNADFNFMVEPPWVLGIMGNARGTNLMGKKAATAIVNCDVKARNWGVLSTDNGDGMALTVADTTLTLVGCDEDKKNPYFKKYGSGYGTYILGTHEEFRGVEMNVGTYIGIARDGTAVYKSSKGDIKLVNPANGKTVYEGTGKGNVSVLNSEAFGIMAHGTADITMSEGTVMNTENAAFLLRCGGIKLNITDKTQLNAKDGVLLQIIDDDDSTVGVNWEGDMELQFNTEFNEKAGWPSENGQISTMMPPPPAPPMPPMPEGEDGEGAPEPPQFDVHFDASDVDLKGDLYNGSGYYGQKAKQLYVTLGDKAVLTGKISATETIHVDENGKQNTHFTQDEYYYLGHVANRSFFNGENEVEVTLNSGSTWNVTGEGVLTSLTVNAGATLNGTVTVDGKAVTPEAGKTYKGDIKVSAK
jgi:hypothetical protein